MPQDQFKLHFIVFIWGFTSVIGVLISLPSVEIVFYRTLIASVALAGIVWYRGRSARGFLLPWRVVVQLLLTGFVVGAHWITFFASAKVSNVSICLAGISTGSLFTALLEPLMKNSRVKWYEVMLGLVIISGLYIIFRFEFDHLPGLLLALLSAFLSAVFTILNSKFTKVYRPLVITFYEMAGACLFTAAFFPLYLHYFSATGQLQLLPDSTDVIYLLLLGLVCTVYAFYISVEIMKRLTAFNVNLTVNLEPVYGIVLAAIVLGEHKQMSQGFYLGTLVILLAVLIYPVLDRKIPKWQRRRAELKAAEGNR